MRVELGRGETRTKPQAGYTDGAAKAMKEELVGALDGGTEELALSKHFQSETQR